MHTNNFFIFSSDLSYLLMLKEYAWVKNNRKNGTGLEKKKRSLT